MTSVNESIVLDGLELNDGTTFGAAEISFPPPPALVEWVRSADSDGSLLSREPPRDNREITVRLWVVQQASSDLMLAKVAQITDKLAEAQRNPDGISLVWTPHDSTLSATAKVLFGEIAELPVTLQDGWIGNAPTVALRMVALPFLEGAEITDFTDDFSTNTIANYTLDAGTGTISVSGGVLVPSSTAEKRLIHTSSAYAPTDSWTTAKFLTGASVASGTAGVIAKRLDASNYLAGQIAAAGASTRVNIVKVDAGVATTLVQSSTFALSTATNYWVRLRVNSNTAVVEMFTTTPTVATAATQTATIALTGGDITKFGAGIAGRNGIRLIPQATDWRADDLTVMPNAHKASEPVLGMEIANVPGDVPAKVRAIVTDAATQSRRLVRVGLESRYYSTTAPADLLIDSASLVTSGYSGTANTRTGAYSSNGVVRSPAIYTQLIAICGLGNLSHVGTFRMFSRIYAGIDAGAPLYVRLAWQEGDGPLRSNQFVAPIVSDAFSDIDLGIVTIPEKVLGTQRWTGQIEAYCDGLGADLDIDYVYLMPVAEGYGTATAPYVYQAGALSQMDDFRNHSGPLSADLALTGAAWATSGSTADFAADIDPTDLAGTNIVSARSTVSDTGTGRFALLGTAVTSNTEVSVRAYRTAAATGVSGAYSEVICRYVDTSNFLRVRYYPGEQLVVYTVVATTSLFIAYLNDAPSLIGEWHTLRAVVYSSGTGYVTLLNAGGAEVARLPFYSSHLATGGALDDGKVGFVDFNSTVTAVTRYYDDFYSGVPPAEPIACYSGQSIEFRDDGMLREDSTGVYWGPPPEPRGGLRGLPPAGTRSRRSRIVVAARRNDVTTAADDQIADSTAVQIAMTPRYLNAPRA